MKIENLEDYVGKKVYFSLDERKDGTGDRWDEYFTTPEEAVTHCEHERNCASASELKKRNFGAYSGIVNDFGYVDSYDPIENGKLYKLHFDGYDCFVAVLGDIVTYYSTAEFVYDTDIRDVEDETSWENDCSGMAFEEFAKNATIIDCCDFNVTDVL